MKIERRRTVVTLYQGNYEHELSELMEQALAAQRHEEFTSEKRQGTKLKSLQLAKQHDELMAEAERDAVKVTLWAISYNEWGPLADRHPPRPEDKLDTERGVNMKTFPRDLLYASLAEPGIGDLDGLIAAGKLALRELGDLSQVQYVKLETAAWNVNVGDDALPKYSLVSLLKRQSDLASKPLNDSE
jgi:hypothetical protein